jgi:hypothetical protein
MPGDSQGAAKGSLLGGEHQRFARKKQPDARRASGRARRSAILVLGMHRSGTSAMARVLNLLGADLPEGLIGPAADNPRGFWESQELLALHDELLAAGGSSWDDWTPLAPDYLETSIAHRFRARLLAWLEANFGGSRLFVIKDPRMCRIVPLWRSILQEFSATVRVVIPIRNPIEVAASLANRDGLSTAWSLLIWLRYVLDAERETRDLPRSIIRFGDLLHDRRRVLATMRRRLAIKWPRPAAAARAEIDEFLSLAERHHSVDDRFLDLRQDIPVEVRKVYQALAAIAHDGESVHTHAELDRVASDLDRANATFGAVVTEQATANRGKTAEINALRRRFEERAAEVQALQQERAAEVQALQQELATVRSVLLERSTDAERAAGELTAVRAELTDVRSGLAECLGEAQRLTEKMSALSSETGHLRNALEALRVGFVSRDAEVDRLRQQLGDVSTQLDYMLHSLSWRLTAPLRAVRGRIGRPKE